MKNLLIIDDSMFQRKILEDFLSEIGYDVTSANNGRQGIDSFDKNNIDCVITDLLMPDISGKQVIETIKQESPETPVIVISADIQKTIKQECEELGVSGFLNKPFNKEELKGLLEKLS